MLSKRTQLEKNTSLTELKYNQSVCSISSIWLCKPMPIRPVLHNVNLTSLSWRVRQYNKSSNAWILLLPIPAYWYQMLPSNTGLLLLVLPSTRYLLPETLYLLLLLLLYYLSTTIRRTRTRTTTTSTTTSSSKAIRVRFPKCSNAEFKLRPYCSPRKEDDQQICPNLASAFLALNVCKSRSGSNVRKL